MPAESLTIEKLVYGGDGLGRLPGGEVLFVPWSAPGDELQVQRQPGKQKPAKGNIEAIVSPASERTKPPCSVFGTCGGCQWQHITPAAQREWKRRIVAESLARLGRLPDVPVLETLGSDETAWHYRNRVQWVVEPAGEELSAQMKYTLGYHQAQSHDVVAFDHCWIIEEPLNALALWLREYVQTHPLLASAILRLEAFINREGDMLLAVEGEKHPDLSGFAQAVSEAFPKLTGVVFLKNGVNPKVLTGQGFLKEQFSGHRFRISAGSFFQTNHQAAEAMVRILQSWLLPDVESLIDIYAGVGTFSVALKDSAQRILVLEGAPVAVEDARENIQLNGATHIALQAGDVSATLRRLIEDFEVAILDPPRAGCPPEVLDWLSKHVRKQLLYVSCNPTTLARDLQRLTSQGWRIEAVQPIDMFPQTYHIETVVNLRR